ncbi:sensor histidine kinase [Shimia biformata]|uniref:sensor histidine kinase n=1 Tax=Shimia biformata TaxID=1294299 RepID=UPI00194F0AC6|nr:ATP-binding protein [Shimia biformata]
MAVDDLKSLLEAIPLPAVLIGPDARLRGANAAAIALNPQAGTERSYILVFRQPGLAGAIDDCLSSRDTRRAIYQHTDGAAETRFDVSCAYVTLAGAEGVLVTFTDVTSFEQAGQIRRDFVANVSHELRTPLTAIMGFIETLQGPARDDAAARDRFLGTMADEAQRMVRLVGDLLSLSRVEEEARMRPTAQVDLVPLIAATARNLSSVAEDRGGEIIFEAPGAPITVTADRDQMMQVFTNLIENGLKYGGQGCRVTITSRMIARDHVLRCPAIAITVSDTGPGIDEKHVPRLTERFYRIDSHRSRAMGGTGLGLAIVKHILNRHRGRLAIESTLGEGSDFTVILPQT